MDIASRIAKLESIAAAGSGATLAERQTAKEILRKIREEHPEAARAKRRGPSFSTPMPAPPASEATFREIVEDVFGRKLEDLIDEGPARDDFRSFLKIFS